MFCLRGSGIEPAPLVLLLGLHGCSPAVYHIFCGFWHSELENPYFIMDDHSDRKYDPFYESTDL